MLLHDYRDVRYLKRVTAVGVVATLFPATAITYAVAYGADLAIPAFLSLQTFGACMLLLSFLRSYVARATLDPRRARLAITGCGFFGEPLSTDQYLPLALIKPQARINDKFIMFNIDGSAFNPATWVAYRIPRAQTHGDDRKPGAQVGFRPLVSANVKVEVRRDDGDAGASKSTTGSGHRFLGAGLGARGGAVAEEAPRRPTTSRAAEAAARPAAPAGDEGGFQEGAAPAQKSLAGLKLHHGLPASGAEEQKIIDFFDDPAAYAAVGLRLR